MQLGNHKIRDLFAIENAKNLEIDELVETFVPTETYWKLFNPKNQIILGSRGSGKTSLAKMISHDHLSKLNDPEAKKIITSKAFIGIYVATKTEWVGGLKNKTWQTEKEMEYFFQWRLNISSCLAFLVTLRSCLNTYIIDLGDRARTERKIISKLSNSWSESEFECQTINELTLYLEDIEYNKQQQLAKKRVQGKLSNNEKEVGLTFEMDLFEPLKRGIKIVSDILYLNHSTSWFLILDEAEYLLKMHHTIINSYLRGNSSNLYFKITTMPYCHYTLETNIGVPLNVGHDFKYIYIDQENILEWHSLKQTNEFNFVDHIFNKRAKFSSDKYKGISLKKLLGFSKLLDITKFNIDPESNDMKLFRKYASSSTIQRGEDLLKNDPQAFRDQIGRKMRALLLLKDQTSGLKGQKKLDIYSGAKLIVTCGDSNPRRLIQLFNELLKSINWAKVDKTQKPIIDNKKQNSILSSFSAELLGRFKSEENVGPELLDFISIIGDYMKTQLHKKPLTTEQVSSIEIDKKISERHWEIIKRAVGLGLLFPNINDNNQDQMPEREGTFHLAYVLAPHFKILPRRGDSRKLASILSDNNQLELYLESFK